MVNNQRQRFKHRLLILYFILTISFFVTRAAIFAGSYGGIEFDSGWIFGVAKNLAHRGIYASYSNIIPEEDIDSHTSIYGRFAVQDRDGFCYFPPCTFSIGPGYVIPEAILIKLFGDGWWQYRSWPMLGYIGFLILVFYVVWRTGGIWALMIIQVWLWVVPQFTVTLAYESFSEHIGLLYLMGSFLLFCRTSRSGKKDIYMLMSGCLLSIAALTKLLLVLALPVFATFALWELYRRQVSIRSILFRWSLFVTGFVVPIVLFESYRSISLLTKFGPEGWGAIYKDFREVFVFHGSGVAVLNRFDWSFIYAKLHVWSHVGVEPFWVAWACLLVSPVFLFKRFQSDNWRLVGLIMGSGVFLLSWFVLISPSGWGHHAWFGLFLSMMSISITLGAALDDRTKNLNKRNVFIMVWIFALIGLSARLDKMEIRPLLDQKTINKWIVTKQGGYGYPHVPVYPLADQNETMDFFSKEIRKEDRLYYLHIFLVAEMSSLVDKVFYPLPRYFDNGQENPDGGLSYLILGPYQQGPLRQVPEWYQQAAIQTLCNKIVFSNQSYSICTLKKDSEE